MSIKNVWLDSLYRYFEICLFMENTVRFTLTWGFRVLWPIFTIGANHVYVQLWYTQTHTKSYPKTVELKFINFAVTSIL
jgi:hypothetical protein